MIPTANIKAENIRPKKMDASVVLCHLMSEYEPLYAAFIHWHITVNIFNEKYLEYSLTK